MAAAAASDPSEVRTASAALAATAVLGEGSAAKPIKEVVGAPAALGIDMKHRSWFRDALHWGLAFRSAFRGSGEAEPGSFTLARGLRARVASVPADFAAVDWFVRSLADFEKARDDVELDAASFQRDGTGPSPAITVILVSQPADSDAGGEAAEELRAGAPAGHVDVAFAMFTTAYSSWRGRCLYLEDLYVVPAARRAGIGTEMLCVAAAAAEAAGCSRVVWVALNWNEPALACYDKIGAVRLSEWTTLRLEDDKLTQAAVS